MSRAEQIEMIRRHIAEGEKHVESQRAVVKRLRELGAETGLAEDLLEEFEATLAEHRRHLAQVGAARQ
jgi:uncharacterized coiled-coil protein SlyX